MSEKEENLYNKELSIARNNWQQLCSNDQKHEALKKKLNSTEQLLEQKDITIQKLLAELQVFHQKQTDWESQQSKNIETQNKNIEGYSKTIEQLTARINELEFHTSCSKSEFDNQINAYQAQLDQLQQENKKITKELDTEKEKTWLNTMGSAFKTSQQSDKTKQEKQYAQSLMQYQQKINSLSEQLSQLNKEYNTLAKHYNSLMKAYKEEKEKRINLENSSKVLINDLNKFYRQQKIRDELGEWIGDMLNSFSKKVFEKSNKDDK
jgi:chromosome segregation ATPase